MKKSNIVTIVIIIILSVLDNPNLRLLADEETPTYTSGNLGTTGNAIQEDNDEEEDYNDISSIICLKCFVS